MSISKSRTVQALPVSFCQGCLHWFQVSQQCLSKIPGSLLLMTGMLSRHTDALAWPQKVHGFHIGIVVFPGSRWRGWFSLLSAPTKAIFARLWLLLLKMEAACGTSSLGFTACQTRHGTAALTLTSAFPLGWWGWLPPEELSVETNKLGSIYLVMFVFLKVWLINKFNIYGFNFISLSWYNLWRLWRWNQRIFA